MKFLATLLKKIRRNEMQKPLGRWNIEHCNKKINNKIDLSNEDHCGPCGQYAMSKVGVNTEIKNKNNKNSNIEMNYKKPDENIV